MRSTTFWYVFFERAHFLLKFQNQKEGKMPGRIDQGIQVRNAYSELSIENEGKRDIDPGFSVGTKNTQDIDAGFNIGGKNKTDTDPGFSFGEKQTRRAEAGMHGQISRSDLLDKLKISERAEKIHKAITGFGTDEKAITDSLAGLNKKERDQLEKEYKAKYGKSLNNALQGKVSDEKAILSGLNGDGRTQLKQMIMSQNKVADQITKNL